MTMKYLFFLFLLLSKVSIAGNFLIPTCDLSKNKDLFQSLGDDSLNEKIGVFIHRRDHCDAATGLLELYTRGGNSESKLLIRKNIFDSLAKGKFLNEYTALYLGLGKDFEKQEIENVMENLVILYTKFITSKGTNPSSQFYVGSKSLALFDEAELQFRYFLRMFPGNKSYKKVHAALVTIYDRKIFNSIEYINFYGRNASFEGDLLSRELIKLMKLLVKGHESRYFIKAIHLIQKELAKANLDLRENQKIKLILNNFINNKFSRYQAALELNEFLITESRYEPHLNIPTSLDGNENQDLSSFLFQKGEDKSVFLPINKDFKFSATKTLVSLGVVGILMVFDEPIMNFIQRNKDAGIMDEIANYGNHFGQVSGLAPLVLGSFGYGLVFENNKAKNAALSSIGAVILGQLVIETLKSATHRSRPEAGLGPFDFGGFGLGSDNTSFASGHSAAAWSVASVFAEEFGDEYKWAPAAAYGLAALTSYARMNKNKHWASDVVMGALVGYVAGKIFHKFYREVFKDWAENITITPMIGSMNGIRVEIRERMYADLKKWPLDLLYGVQQSIFLKHGIDNKILDNIYNDVFLDRLSKD